MSWKAGRPKILTASGPTMYWPAKIWSSVDLPAEEQCGLSPTRRSAACASSAGSSCHIGHLR